MVAVVLNRPEYIFYKGAATFWDDQIEHSWLSERKQSAGQKLCSVGATFHDCCLRWMNASFLRVPDRSPSSYVAISAVLCIPRHDLSSLSVDGRGCVECSCNFDDVAHAAIAPSSRRRPIREPFRMML